MSATRRLTGGLSAVPLVVLSLLFFFDEWDTAAFNVLAPDIQSAFHLSDHGFGLLVIGNLSAVLLIAVPLGFLGDRLPRVWFVTGGALVAGVFSLLTGVAGSLLALALIRLGNGVGRLVNDPIHSSLLSDYYRPDDRPAVYAVHRNAERAAQVVGPAVAGIVAALAGWRAAFMVLLVPIGITAFVSLRLREPTRGATDDPASAEIAAKEAPVPFGEARRTLFAVPTLRRQFTSFFFIGAGLVPLAFYVPIFLDRVFAVGPLGRGIVVSINGAAAFLGVLLSGRWTARWLRTDLGEPIKWAGISLVGVGVGIAVLCALPNLYAVVAMAAVTSFVGGIFTPPFVTTQALVSPARVRSLSFAWAALFLLAGVWVLFIILPVSTIADAHGIRLGLAATTPYWVIGGVVMASAKKFVAADSREALDSLAFVTRLRQQRAAGEQDDVLLHCQAVSVAYDGVRVLFGVDMEVHRGEIVALLGTNGAGKSTLLKAITGLVDPAGGVILFDGRDITHADAVAAAKLGIAQMPGGKGVFPTLTVDEHFQVAAWLLPDKADVQREVDAAFARFPRLRERRGQLAGNLSGGEQQMLALAMAFITKPRLLLIDELSLGLAPTIVEMLLETVREINAQGTTIVLVEQSVNVALTVADRAYFLEKGEVRFSGPTKELLARDDVMRSVFLAGATKGAGKRKAAPARTSVRQAMADVERTQLLEAQSITVSFGGIHALDDVDLAVVEGEIVGLIGPNGAGKTTLFDVLSGFVSPSRGRVRLGGYDVTDLAADARARMGLGRSFQDARIFASLTVAENLAIALERHLPIRDHAAAALGLPAVREQEDHIAWSVHDLVELMGLGAFRDKFVSELSTGSRRVVDIAMALAHDPAVLILDEPSSGIAQRETEALGPLLRQIRDETGCALLVIEHDMPLIAEVSNRLIALDQGRVIAAGLPDDVLADPLVVASYLGTDEKSIRRSGTTVPAGGRRS
ncbi:MAG: branched-chain amino acid transport system ATP-binding protein [Frankiaceae bacterium]|nr:branched-chain amino acid transport system ATP-binding protein [Frankiaceae bacterium]